jgi:hypothetical protein
MSGNELTYKINIIGTPLDHEKKSDHPVLQDAQDDY